MPSPAKATNLAKRRLQKVLTKSKMKKRHCTDLCESDILQNAAKATKTEAKLLQYHRFGIHNRKLGKKGPGQNNPEKVKTRGH